MDHRTFDAIEPFTQARMGGTMSYGHDSCPDYPAYCTDPYRCNILMRTAGGGGGGPMSPVLIPNPEMLSAWDMKKKSHEAIEAKFQEALAPIFTSINKDAQDGSFSCAYPTKGIPPESLYKIKEHFTALGYNVQEYHSQLTIRWNEAEEPEAKKTAETQSDPYVDPEHEVTKPEPKRAGWFGKSGGTGGR